MKVTTSSVATGARGARALPTPVRPGLGNWELPKSEEKKLKVGWGYRIIMAKQITLEYVL